MCEGGFGGDAVDGGTVVFSCYHSLRAVQVTPGQNGAAPRLHVRWSVTGLSPGPPIIAGGVVWDVGRKGTLSGYRLSGREVDVLHLDGTGRHRLSQPVRLRLPDYRPRGRPGRVLPRDLIRAGQAVSVVMQRRAGQRGRQWYGGAGRTLLRSEYLLMVTVNLAFIAISPTIGPGLSSPLPFGSRGSPLMVTDMHLSIAGLTDNKKDRRQF